MAEERADRCGTCRHWQDRQLRRIAGGEAQGDCHRHPPRGDDGRHRYWPITLASDWCGEYKAAGEGKP
jgi:hypothetical protein